MGESEGLSKDEKLAMAVKIVSQIELKKAEKSDIYDILVILGHLTFPGREVTLSVKNFVIP